MRAPWTLWAYIFFELCKLVLLTSTVLVTVIAFAAVIKPLADGKLDPLMAFRFMMLATVAMLQYALPFAACFAATLVYHRVSSDNELTAAYAGGVSHRTLLAPAAVTGVVLSLGLLLLSQQIIPRVLRGMAEMVTADAAQYLQTQIARGQSVEVGRTLIHADKVIPARAPDGYRDAMVLLGLLVVRLDDDGTIAEQLSARSAPVWTRSKVRGVASEADRSGAVTTQVQSYTELIVKPEGVVAKMNTMRGTGDAGTFRLLIPTDLRDNPKFLTWGELNELFEAPERIDVIERHRHELAQTLAERMVVEQLRKTLADTGRAELVADDVRLVLRGTGVRPVRTDGKVDPRLFQIVGTGEPGVVVERTMPTGKQDRQTPAVALIRFTDSGGTPDAAATFEDLAAASNVTFDLLLRDVALERMEPAPRAGTGQGAAGADDDAVDLSALDLQPAPGEAKERRINRVALAKSPDRKVMDMNTWDLIRDAEDRAEARGVDRQLLGPRLTALRSQVDDLLREVVSKQHERYAHSLACFTMLMLGAIMAMRLRDALPLTIYLWAFFPALATVLTISGGQQLAHGKGLVGLPVLYSGVALLGVFAVVQFTRLSRH